MSHHCFLVKSLWRFHLLCRRSFLIMSVSYSSRLLRLRYSVLITPDNTGHSTRRASDLASGCPRASRRELARPRAHARGAGLFPGLRVAARPAGGGATASARRGWQPGYPDLVFHRRPFGRVPLSTASLQGAPNSTVPAPGDGRFPPPQPWRGPDGTSARSLTRSSRRGAHGRVPAGGPRT